MASLTRGTTFVDGVANDVTAAKLSALVDNATPTSGFIQDRTAETITATNDTLLIGDASDSNNLKRITVANFAQTLPTAKVTTGTIETGTFGTTTSTAATITTGTIPTLTAGTTTSTAANITNGTVQTLTASTANISQGSAILTRGTIATLNSTTGTIANLSATTSTFLGTITGSTNVINIGSGQISKDTSGNVGIAGGSVSITRASADYNVIALVNTSGVEVQLNANGNTEGNLRTVTNHPLSFTTNNIERLRIDSSGNVSIGTATSLSKLHVHGDLTMSNATVSTTAATGGLTLPATAAGYLTVSINGTSRKIPYYA